MQSHQENYIDFLDGFRGIAILSVFLLHALYAGYGYVQLPWNGIFRGLSDDPSFIFWFPLTYGGAGVSIFFALSGFCVHLSFSKDNRRSWKNYAIRRFFRIYPPYLVVLAIFSFIPPWSAVDLSELSGRVQLITHLFFVHNLDYRTFYAINGSFWSVAVEVQLYLIYPLLVFWSIKRGWKKVLYLTATLEISIQYASEYFIYAHQLEITKLIVGSPLAYWCSWALGAYLAERYIHRRQLPFAQIPIWIPGMLVIIAPIFRPLSPLSFLSFSFLTVVVIAKLIKSEGALSHLSTWWWRHLSALGRISYGFYLIHQPILNLTSIRSGIWEIDGVSPSFRFLLCLLWYPIVFYLSRLFFHCIENPSSALGRKYLV